MEPQHCRDTGMPWPGPSPTSPTPGKEATHPEKTGKGERNRAGITHDSTSSPGKQAQADRLLAEEEEEEEEE